jgi:pyruvate/2-oxoglutarate dehydrogenase complex dihydrolipoamide acyltransferase (E2) component
MSIPVRMPQFGEAAADATVVAWLVQPGTAVKAEQELVEVQTEKSLLTVAAPVDGILVSGFSTGQSSQTILPVLRRIAWFAGSRTAPPPSETTCRVDLATARIVSLSIWRKFASPARAKKEEIGSLRDSSIWWSVSTQSNPRAEARKGAMEVFPLPRYPIR